MAHVWFIEFHIHHLGFTYIIFALLCSFYFLLAYFNINQTLGLPMILTVSC